MFQTLSGARRFLTAAALLSSVSIPSALGADPVASSPTINLWQYGNSAETALTSLASDADGDTLTFSFGTPNAGSVYQSGGYVYYYPDLRFTGTDSFTFTVQDPSGGTASGMITVNDVHGPEFYDLPYGVVLIAGQTGEVALPDFTWDIYVEDNGVLESVEQTPEPGTMLPVGIHTITFTATDSAGLETVETVDIEVAARVAVTHASGGAVEGEPSGTVALRFGTPSINSNGESAYLARLVAPRTRSVTAIVAGQPASVLVRSGDAAPGVEGATFSFLRDPVLDNDGGVAFMAYLRGETITRDDDRGIWAYNGESLQLVAREGGAPPELPEARFQRFVNISMQDGEVLFLAYLVQGVGGIDATNDVGVWSWNEWDGLMPVIREGGAVLSPSGVKTVKLFSMLRSSSGSAGQGRTHASFGTYTLWAKCTDGTKAILISLPFWEFPEERDLVAEGEDEPPFPFEGIPLIAIAETRAPLDEGYLPGITPKAFGLPAISSDFGLAVSMLLSSNATAGVNSSNNAGIFVGSLFDGWETVARKGDLVVDETRWLSFKDPVINDNYDVAWIGRLSGTNVTRENDYAIWLSRGCGCWEEGGEELLTAESFEGDGLIAREGDEPPGVPGAKWTQFISLALPDGGERYYANGPIFLARIASNLLSETPAVVSSENDIGLWAVDGNDELRLLLREGDMIEVNGAQKQIKSMTLLNSVPGSKGVSRSFNDQGQIILRARFTDGTQAIVTLRMEVSGWSEVRPV